MSKTPTPRKCPGCGVGIRYDSRKEYHYGDMWRWTSTVYHCGSVAHASQPPLFYCGNNFHRTFETVAQAKAEHRNGKVVEYFDSREWRPCSELGSKWPRNVLYRLKEWKEKR